MVGLGYASWSKGTDEVAAAIEVDVEESVHGEVLSRLFLSSQIEELLLHFEFFFIFVIDFPSGSSVLACDCCCRHFARLFLNQTLKIRH